MNPTMTTTTPKTSQRASRVAATLAAAGLAITAFAPAAVAQDSSAQNDVEVARKAPPTSTLADVVTKESDKNSIQPGPPSGSKVEGGPFDGQVLPGFGGLIANGDGTFYGLPDNGFGEKSKSADFLLRLYKIKPKWETQAGAEQNFDVIKTISFSDPDGHMPGKITNEDTKERLLTGADLDPEAIQRGKDGTFWVGDEYGPWVLHFDKDGRLMEEPVTIPFNSPDNPVFGPNPNQVVQRSGGFEGLARSKDGRFLYAVLEKNTTDRDGRDRMIFEIDIEGWEGEGPEFSQRYWYFQANAPENRISDAQIDQNGRLLLLERDDKEGAEAKTKRIYSVRLTDDIGDFYLPKRSEVNLLQLKNPNNLGEFGGVGQGNPYAFTAKEPAAMVVLKNGDVVVANDTNYPFDKGIFGNKIDPITLLKIARTGVN